MGIKPDDDKISNNASPPKPLSDKPISANNQTDKPQKTKLNDYSKYNISNSLQINNDKKRNVKKFIAKVEDFDLDKVDLKPD